jgi:hypothetical protein
MNNKKDYYNILGLDREASLPAHSVRPQQVLVIEELEAAIEEKKKELERLIKEKMIPSLE